MRFLTLLFLALVALPAFAENARIAVATNFASLARQLAADYGRETSHEITIVAGATGKLYAQISTGAPFDAFLAADTATPARLLADQSAVADSRFTYAVGTLVLWSKNADLQAIGPAAALKTARHIAIANPDLAPYGKAAIQVIDNMDISQYVSEKIVMGENIGQAFALVATGAADIGFVAASSLTDSDTTSGTIWAFPAGSYVPIRQDAVLLRRGSQNPAARGFLDYLRQDRIRKRIRASGYEATP